MTTFPLDSLGVTIDETGASAPPYSDILTSLQVSYRGIYGSDANLDDNTQDGQFLAVFAKAINDDNNSVIAAYNARSPSSAQGVGLSSVVKINGLDREAQSNSTTVVVIVGVTGTSINGGIVGDSVGLGTQWTVPAFTNIGDDGTATITVTCTTPGAITAEPGTLTVILTPTIGWQTVSNGAVAAPGNPVEVDATLRQRQSTSQGQASQSPVIATKSAIGNLVGVTRVDYDENQGSGPDANGVPGKSVAFIVEGGDVVQIAQTIALKKTIGCGTFGTTSEVVVDPAGRPVTINFFVLDLTTIVVVVTISALAGYSDTTAALIQAAVSAYVSSLPIGSIVYINKVEAVAALMGSPLNATFEITGVTLNAGTTDVAIDFNKSAFCTVGDVSVVVGP